MEEYTSILSSIFIQTILFNKRYWLNNIYCLSNRDDNLLKDTDFWIFLVTFVH